MSTTTSTEETTQLVIASQKGDSTAFGVLYDQHVRKIYDFVYYKTMHRQTAEDLTSEIFMKALDKIQTYKPHKASFTTWLYQIARNTMIDFFRKNKHHSVNINDETIERTLTDHSDMHTATDAVLRLEQVRSHLNQLTPEQRDIIMMRVWQELSYQEIAAIMDKSEANCKMIFSRGIKELRRVMPLTLFLWFLITS